MRQTVLLVVHQGTSDTGRLGRKLAARGYGLEVRCPMRGDPLPERLDGHVAAVVFGGPMSANDEHLPGIRAELDWLPSVLDTGRPFLGICLGAQLLARVLGARVAPHPEGRAEIGYFPVSPTPAADGFLDGRLMVYHWHREGFELPRGAVWLAEGDSFPHQAFRCGAATYGVQYHPEVTGEIMARWLRSGAAKLTLPGAQPRDEQLAGHRRHDRGIDAWLERFLDRWLAADAAPAPQSL
jgi:GMP synthase (glutamine-hydrolysing)